MTCKKLFLSLLILAISSFLSGCDTFREIKTTSNYPPTQETIDFSSLTYYRWLPGLRLANDEQIPEAVDTEISNAINQEFIAKGFSESAASPVDFLVNYSVTAKDRVDIRTYKVYEGYAPGFTWQRHHGFQMAKMSQQEKTEMVEYREGTLVIDILNPEDKTIIWRGVGRKTIPDTFRESQRKRTIENIVRAILENFPPK